MSDLRKAAEMALEALEWINRVNAMDYEYQRKAQEPIQALRQALSQPEQEPVAWINDYGFWKYKPKNLNDLTPLYTAPSEREWVGLTDEEISEVLGSDIHLENSGELQFIRAIEAKLKEKNT